MQEPIPDQRRRPRPDRGETAGSGHPRRAAALLMLGVVLFLIVVSLLGVVGR